MSTPAPSAPPVTGPVVVYNARISDVAPTVVSEQVAEKVAFNYDAQTQGSSFTFESRAFMYVNGAPLPVAGTSTNFLQTDTTPEMMATCFGQGLRDPVTGIDLSKVSTAGVALIFKMAFDILYNRRAAASAAPNPNQPYPSIQAITQANYLWDVYGNGLNGYPLGKAFGGLGTTDGAAVSPTPPTPPNPLILPDLA